ncbi:MAG: Nif3-like dinuclear metal center hexameric protein [Saprospiraceae bacterium]|nr:Nif3-like dinuclear metal center hexameric protein [Saprospiraceae bacterium]
MLIEAITSYLEGIAPLELQEPYDNAGLLTGSKTWEATGAILCLDSTEEVIQEAIAKRCNLVIAHHPIIFSGLKRLTGAHYIERAIICAIKHDIAIYAIHTNLDNILQDGVNQKIAQRLKLADLQILAPKESATIGSGLLGTLPEAMPPSDFIEFVKNQMHTSCIRHTKILDKPIGKVAICGGSGRFLLSDAIAHQADAFVSADFKYHEFFEANDEIVVLDIGHYESEQFTIALLRDLLTRKFANFAAHNTEVVTNPINYR